jgi:hypothetical protein
MKNQVAKERLILKKERKKGRALGTMTGFRTGEKQET